jgi:hypothetical protein
MRVIFSSETLYSLRAALRSNPESCTRISFPRASLGFLFGLLFGLQNGYIPPGRRVVYEHHHSPKHRTLFSQHCQNLSFNRKSTFVAAKYKIGYPFRAEKKHYLHYKDHRLMLFGETINNFCENNLNVDYVEKDS